jgi:hypothetical protein
MAELAQKKACTALNFTAGQHQSELKEVIGVK